MEHDVYRQIQALCKHRDNYATMAAVPNCIIIIMSCLPDKHSMFSCLRNGHWQRNPEIEITERTSMI